MNENSHTKILFTDDELQLLNNSDIIFKKRAALKKISTFLEQFESEQKNILSEYSKVIPAEAYSSQGKISRGENYKELPYLILDYPRVFEKENVFAFRTLFWWGNFFSFTIQLSGRYMKNIKPCLPNIFTQLKSEVFFVCLNQDEWQHQFDESNYQSLKNLCETEGGMNRILSHSFLKITRKISIENYDQCYDYGLKTYQLFLSAWSKNIKSL